MGWVTRVLIRDRFDRGWGGLGWGRFRGGSDFEVVLFRVRNRVYLLGTHAGSFVLVGLQKVVPKWFQRWFRFGRWFQLVPFGVVPTG